MLLIRAEFLEFAKNSVEAMKFLIIFIEKKVTKF